MFYIAICVGIPVYGGYVRDSTTVLSNVQCQGNETTLLECPSDGFQDYYCPYQLAGALCYSEPFACTSLLVQFTSHNYVYLLCQPNSSV